MDPDPDPRLQGASQAFTRLTTVADQCLEQGTKRWTAALDRQELLLTALGETAVQIAKTPPVPKPAPARTPADSATDSATKE
ncbi:hypothetical protein ACNOYE_30940 [Nannocystaceae bacterium ST9]